MELKKKCRGSDVDEYVRESAGWERMRKAVTAERTGPAGAGPWGCREDLYHSFGIEEALFILESRKTMCV